MVIVEKEESVGKLISLYLDIKAAYAFQKDFLCINILSKLKGRTEKFSAM